MFRKLSKTQENNTLPFVVIIIMMLMMMEEKRD